MMKICSKILKNSSPRGFASLTQISKHNFGTSTTASGENPVLRGIKLQHEAAQLAEKLEYQEALAKAEKAREIAEQGFGSNHTYTAEALIKTAEYNDILGYFEKAMSDSKKAVEILKGHATSHKPTLSAALRVASKAHASGGSYIEALNLEEDAYEMHRDLFGENNIQTLRSLVGLGDRYRLVGNLGKASEILNTCLEEAERLYDKDSYEKLILHMSLAELGIDKKDFDQANFHADKLLTATREMKTYKHPLYGKMNNLFGELEMKEKDYEDALEYLENSKEFYEKIFEGSHPDMAMTLTLIAMCYLAQGYPERAKITQESAIKMFNNFTADVTHPQYSIMNLCLADIMRQSSEKQGASKLAEESFSNLSAKLGENHPKTVFYKHILANYGADSTSVV